MMLDKLKKIVIDRMGWEPLDLAVLLTELEQGGLAIVDTTKLDAERKDFEAQALQAATELPLDVVDIESLRDGIELDPLQDALTALNMLDTIERDSTAGYMFKSQMLNYAKEVESEDE